MAETQRRSVWGQLRRSRTSLAIASLGVVLGCGPRIDAANHGVTTCDSESSVFRAVGKLPIPSKNALLDQVTTDASLLRQRADASGGKIDLPDHWNIEMHAGANQLELSYPTNDSLGFHETANIYIHFSNEKPLITIGAFACSHDGGIYQDAAAVDMHHYVAETAALSN